MVSKAIFNKDFQSFCLTFCTAFSAWCPLYAFCNSGLLLRSNRVWFYSGARHNAETDLCGTDHRCANRLRAIDTIIPLHSERPRYSLPIPAKFLFVAFLNELSDIRSHVAPQRCTIPRTGKAIPLYHICKKNASTKNQVVRNIGYILMLPNPPNLSREKSTLRSVDWRDFRTGLKQKYQQKTYKQKEIESLWKYLFWTAVPSVRKGIPVNKNDKGLPHIAAVLKFVLIRGEPSLQHRNERRLRRTSCCGGSRRTSVLPSGT